MAFYGDGQKFVGDDGLVQKATFGAVVNGDGATPLATGLYLVLAKAAVSNFPPNTVGTAIAVGDFLLVDAGVAITPAIGDNVVTVVVEDLCDISSFTIPFTKDEIDVTTLCDTIKKYRSGKADMNGTMNGIFTAGISDEVDGFLRQFIRIAKQDGSTSFDSYSQQDSILLGIFYINKNSNIADRMAIIAPFTLFGYSLGGEMGSAQSFKSGFRFSNLVYDDGTYEITIEPTFYRWGTSLDT
jgi:hypothetical protein